MSQQRWIRGPLCGIDNCRSRLYRHDSGRKFCQFGHMAEGNLEFDDEDGEFNQTKRLNISLTDTGFGSQATSATKKVGGISSQKSKQRYFGKQGRIYVYKCLQYILRQIAPKVVTYLYKDLGDETVESLLASVNPVLKLLWMRCVKDSFNRHLPNVGDLYVLVYLALRQVNRYPVFFDEYLKMLCKNEVPYLTARWLLTPEMRSTIPIGSHDVFDVLWLPLDDYFYIMITKWSRSLMLRGITVTALDHSYPMALKIIIDLRLPHVPQLLALYHEIAMEIKGGIVRQNSVSGAGSTEVKCIALIYLVVRLHLTASPEVFNLEEWIEWLSRDEELPLFQSRSQTMTHKEIMNLSNKQVTEYLDWANDTLVPKAYKDLEDDSLPIMKKKLAQIFTYSQSDRLPSVASPYAPIGTVKNSLTSSELVRAETHLQKYLCSRFGIRSSTLKEASDRIKRKLPKSMIRKQRSWWNTR